MGNCLRLCCGGDDDDNVAPTTTSSRKFQGQGQRLGAAGDAYGSGAAPATSNMKRDEDEDIPEPAVDPNLTDEERAKIRRDRAAAAEARLKKQTGGVKKKKPASTDGEPLRGPNSEPLMRWTA